MPDAAANLSEEEKALHALLRSLSACLIQTRERAEQIAELDFERFVPSLAHYRKQRGILEFSEGEYVPTYNSNRPPNKKQPIIKYGKAVPKLTFGMISIALTSERSELQDFSQSLGFDLSALRSSLTT